MGRYTPDSTVCYIPSVPTFHPWNKHQTPCKPCTKQDTRNHLYLRVTLFHNYTIKQRGLCLHALKTSSLVLKHKTFQCVANSIIISLFWHTIQFDYSCTRQERTNNVTHQHLLCTLQCIGSGEHSLNQVSHSGRSLLLYLFYDSKVSSSDLWFCRYPTCYCRREF